MAAPGVTMIQRFLYRDHLEEYSNQYHFQGEPPSDDAGWESLIDALKAIVAEGLTDVNTIIRAYGYEDTDNDSVFTDDMLAHGDTQIGSIGAGSGGTLAPGDAAAWVRWKRVGLSSTGKPVYLRKYFHGIYTQTEAGEPDKLMAGVTAGMNTFGIDLLASSGAWPGLADKNGVAPTGHLVSPFVTTRTLKRRGVRPH